jgi:phenylacetate-CoA ligase
MDLAKLQSWRERLHGLLHNTMYLSSYELSDNSMREYAKRLNRFQPKLLISYPSPLATFSRFLLDNEISVHSIKSIVTSAEMLFDWQRDVIQQAFEGEVFDRYGCREFGNIAHECEAHEGYHVNCERVFLEVLDDDGTPVEPGQLGKLYVTDLDNLGFPFLRYEIGDLAIPSVHQCSCGRGLPLIEKLAGRSFDIICCPNGNRVAGTFWTICLRRFPGVERFQVEQDALDSLVIRLVTSDHYRQEQEESICAEIRKKCGNEMNIRYDYVDQIKPTSSGKERLVISSIHGA